MIETRLNGTEKNAYEKADKLAGKNNVAKKILYAIIRQNLLDESFFDILDKLGIYDNHIILLYRCCKGCQILDFVVTVCELDEGNVPRDVITAIKTQAEFKALKDKYEAK